MHFNIDWLHVAVFCGGYVAKHVVSGVVRFAHFVGEVKTMIEEKNS